MFASSFWNLSLIISEISKKCCTHSRFTYIPIDLINLHQILTFTIFSVHLYFKEWYFQSIESSEDSSKSESMDEPPKKKQMTAAKSSNPEFYTWGAPDIQELTQILNKVSSSFWAEPKCMRKIYFSWGKAGPKFTFLNIRRLFWLRFNNDAHQHRPS